MGNQIQFSRKGIGAIPLIDQILAKIHLREVLIEALGNERYADAILLLLKNILIERDALYAVQEWAEQFDPTLTQGGKIGDDAIARALSRLFEVDRACFLTRVVLMAVKEFDIVLNEIHQDTTSVKLFGNYKNQRSRAIQLKRGHSKDHRPDLKQLVYELSVTGDGAVPVLFKAHDGNRTDDSLHWDNWQSLRAIVGRSDFLYVADSKLCVRETLMKIDREKGRFITIVPRTREETKEFAGQAQSAQVRWERLMVKRSARNAKRMDIYDVAVGSYQLSEGFRLYWYRSSEKRKRDQESREERIELALERLRALDELGKRKPRTEAALQRRAEKILTSLKVSGWIRIDVALERIEDYKQKTRGRATEDTDYRKVVKWVPSLSADRDLAGIAQSAAMDGIFPLTTNTDMKPIEILKAYKHQPKLEKRHSLLKSDLAVAPIFLKRNDRIEALTFVFFLAQLVSALLEREVRKKMKSEGVPSIQILPEERPSQYPTAPQIFRAFNTRSKYVVQSQTGKELQTHADPLSKTQKQILKFLGIKESVYL